MTDSAPQVGGEIAAWCTRCKLDLNHTIVAMVGSDVKRVQCLTCEGPHNYKPAGTGGKAAKKKATKKKTTTKKRARSAVPRDGRPGRPYSIGQSFSTDDVIEHPKYGRGWVIDTRGNKIDVEFEDGGGTRVLVHGRSAS